jgi:hypothetical protein
LLHGHLLARLNESGQYPPLFPNIGLERDLRGAWKVIWAKPFNLTFVEYLWMVTKEDRIRLAQALSQELREHLVSKTSVDHTTLETLVGHLSRFLNDCFIDTHRWPQDLSKESVPPDWAAKRSA